jgi:1-acyl-sn-glycerol-3-phosphate acyltransferase
MNSTRLIRQISWASAWTFAAVALVPFVRLRSTGRHHIPRKGAGLLVANHVTLLDPGTVGWASLRRVHGVGSDTILRVPFFGKLVPWLSVIPFHKGMKDRKAMEEVQRRVDEDAMILIFPEGDRSWTGAMNPVGDGIGRLAIRLGVPVYFCRQTTGHLSWPRWAKYPRLLPIVIEFTEPVTYTDDMTAAEVTADIIERISIDPDEHRAPRFSWGWRLAHGLPEFLWACPDCFARSALELDPAANGDGIRCKACEKKWRVDLSCRLQPAHGGPDMTIAAAHAATLAHFGTLPVADPERFAQDGVLLDGPVTLGLIHRGVTKPEPLGSGTLKLTAEALEFEPAGEGVATTIPLDQIRAVLIQLGDQLQVLTQGHTYGIQPKGQSLQMWRHFLNRHRAELKATAKPTAEETPRA